MRLDRNEGARQKYGLILNRELNNLMRHAGEGTKREIARALKVLEHAGVIDWGDEPETEFFAIRLKDISAQHALRCYAGHARQFDQQYSDDVMALADRSGPDHPYCHRPD